MIIRCSSLCDVMSKPKTSTKDNFGLSVKAMEVIEKLADEHCYNTPILFDSKQMKKGRICEQDSIDLFNTVFFNFLTKNDVRKTNAYITGECDLIDGDLIIDIKTSWSLKSFAEMRRKPTDYEWQLRGYMWLYDKAKACTAHCLVNTPPELCRFDDAIHVFDDIPTQDKVIIGNIVERDIEKEQAIIDKWQQCKAYYDYLLDQFNSTGRELP